MKKTLGIITILANSLVGLGIVASIRTNHEITRTNALLNTSLVIVTLLDLIPVNILIWKLSLKVQPVSEPEADEPSSKATKESPLKIGWVIATLILALTTGYGGMVYGQKAGYSQGKVAGDDSGYKRGVAEGQQQSARYGANMLATPQTDYGELLTKYNGLVNDYNALRNSVVNYINSSQYQPRSTIHCTSSNFGSQTTYTNCY